MCLSLPPRGVYAITSQRLNDAELIAACATALNAGIGVLQFRDKRPAGTAKQALAYALRQLCHAHGVPLLINDDIELAAAVGADGVHLGRDDADLHIARARLGANAVIGVSCYDSLERAHAAQSAGASYVAFGRFFPSTSKPLASPAQLDTLRRARAELSLPCVAIGGITPDNGAALVEAGADWLAVIEGLFGQTDIAAATQRYRALFD